jgi:hypothetical protein
MNDSQTDTQGNPEIGMAEGSLEQASENYSRGEHPNSQANLKPFESKSGSDEFFSQLDNDVNGGIIDSPEVTQNQNSGPEQVTHAQDTGSNKQEMQSANSTDWEKRYKDSSREAVKWRDRYTEVEKFVPVLDAMKNDSGLVDHVRDYLKNGGKPAQSIQDQLQIDEDFVFDQQEAMTNPDSDSAKVMNAHVDRMVETRVNSMYKRELENAEKVKQAKARESEEADFMKKHNMSAEDFSNFKNKAKEHQMTLDDIHYLLNKDQTAANVATSTKKDMMNQMKNVRSMPTSASGANSQGKTNASPDREVFENILGFDDSVDNLFG